jgi:hypothetical protein
MLPPDMSMEIASRIDSEGDPWATGEPAIYSGVVRKDMPLESKFECPSDGLILADRYARYYDENAVRKVKAARLQTMDLCASGKDSLGNYVLSGTCSTRDSVHCPTLCRVFPADIPDQKLSNSLANMVRQNMMPVVECAKVRDRFVPKKLRPEKHQGNSLQTIFRTMMQATSRVNVTMLRAKAAELRARLPETTKSADAVVVAK